MPVVSARELSADEALARAVSMPGKQGIMKSPAKASGMSLAYTLETEDVATVYVFNREGGGFYVLSGSDTAPAILGYSDRGTIDRHNMPPALIDWLETYGKDIYNSEKNNCRVISASPEASMKSVAPITKTRWNQDAPYNAKCPDLYGYKTYTGCVATAMAQVMKTYEWPLQGTGTNSYLWNGDSTLTLDFSKVKFDWANMLDSYSGEYTQAQSDAVATLMYAAGMSTDMDYSTRGSGTQGWKAGRGLITNLGYDKSLNYFMRDYYRLDEWNKMIYGELAKGHPVFYAGANTQVGHAFVLDGYDSTTGFFHVNWGWGGSSNGYYSIITLDPGSSQGIGGSSAGYYGNQGALIGLKKAEEGSETIPNWNCSGDFYTEVSAYARKDSTYVEFFTKSASKGFYNFGLTTTTIDFGVKLQASPDSVIYVWSDVYKNLTVGPYLGYRQPVIMSTLFPDKGTYTMTPVYRCNGKVYPLRSPIVCNNSVKLECSADSLKFTPITYTFRLKGSDIKIEGSTYADSYLKGTAKVENLGKEYIGSIYGVLLLDGEVYGAIQAGYVDIVEGGSTEIKFKELIGTGYKGEYQFALSMPDGTLISEPIPVTISPLPSGTPTVKVTEYSFPGSLGGTGMADDPYLVMTSPFDVKASITCTSGFFTYPLGFWMYHLNQSSAAHVMGDDVFIDKGETKVMNFSGDVSAGINLGEMYLGFFSYIKSKTVFRINRNQFIYLKFVGRESGIEDVSLAAENTIGFKVEQESVEVTATEGVKNVEIYNLGGLCVAGKSFGGCPVTASVLTSQLNRGHYIVKITTASQSTTRRMIKK